MFQKSARATDTFHVLPFIATQLFPYHMFGLPFPLNCFHPHLMFVLFLHSLYAGYTKAHTIMNANKALVLYILFCNKNSTEIKLLML